MRRFQAKHVQETATPRASRGDRAFLYAVRNFKGTPDRLYQDTKIKALTKTWLERNLT
ncbi:hypothetical protein ACFYPC_11090 [Streptomyces sp. NPDC005808]|uniref:hypothetical protein n=1 Tax=Streptomyces sp. NPDC005808 TaxID=3364734 RepID=UPI0036C05314